jgi:hypothetical protein
MLGEKIVSADCWITKLEDGFWTYTIQISFKDEKNVEKDIGKFFSGWQLSGTGYDPKNKMIIHIYKKEFDSKQKWNSIKKQFSFDIQLIK